jgi:hypothetical protein
MLLSFRSVLHLRSRAYPASPPTRDHLGKPFTPHSPLATPIRHREQRHDSPAWSVRTALPSIPACCKEDPTRPSRRHTTSVRRPRRHASFKWHLMSPHCFPWPVAGPRLGLFRTRSLVPRRCKGDDPPGYKRAPCAASPAHLSPHPTVQSRHRHSSRDSLYSTRPIHPGHHHHYNERVHHLDPRRRVEAERRPVEQRWLAKTNIPRPDQADRELNGRDFLPLSLFSKG